MGEIGIRSIDNGWIVSWKQKEYVFTSSDAVWKFIRDVYLAGK